MSSLREPVAMLLEVWLARSYKDQDTAELHRHTCGTESSITHLLFAHYLPIVALCAILALVCTICPLFAHYS